MPVASDPPRPAGESARFPIAEHLRPGDTVLVGQATAEPPGLVSAFLSAARSIDDLTAFCGYTLSDAWREVEAGRPRIVSYVAHASLRRLAARGLVEFVPGHYSAFERLIVGGHIPIDVVLLQVGPPDENGDYDLGPTIDYAHSAALQARVVLVEVNEHMPRTRSSHRLPASRVTAAITTREPLAGSPARMPSEDELRVADNVAPLIPDGATVQFGACALIEALAARLHDRRGLRVVSGLAGDWLVDLDAAGAMAEGPDSCVMSMALGGERMYAFLRESPWARFADVRELVSLVNRAEAQPFVAVNCALEVDLQGQVNSEATRGRYVGAVGGQVDFTRAAGAAPDGLGICALASRTPSGAPRIVTVLDGTVTTLKSDVHVVVTEWGAADLRGATFAQRAERLIAVAHPDDRPALRAARVPWA